MAYLTLERLQGSDSHNGNTRQLSYAICLDLNCLYLVITGEHWVFDIYHVTLHLDILKGDEGWKVAKSSCYFSRELDLI